MDSQHHQISFTVEQEAEDQVVFVDDNITKTKDGFGTDVFNKESFIGLGLKLNSFVPLDFKFNVIQTLTVRAYNISSKTIFHL